jgi:predicted acetyltransferase
LEIQTKDNGRNHLRELIVDGKSVSWLTLIDYTVRIGRARLRMGGIAGVGTSEDCRMKGYSRSVLEDTTSYMTQEGYDIALLFGIPDYYHKFGYAVCLSEPSFNMDTAQSANLEADDSYVFSPANESDVPKMMHLYNEVNAGRTLSIERFPEYFKGFTKGSRWGVPAEAVVIKSTDGKFLGYTVFDAVEDAMTVIEVESIDPGAYKSILKYLAKRAEMKNMACFKFMMPQIHPFSVYCRRFNCSVNINYNRCSGGMGRIINQNTMFVKLRDELSQRIERSEYAGYSGTILISTDIGETVLSILDGEVRVVCASDSDNSLEIPQSKLMQLVTGYRPIRDLMADDEVKLTGDVVALLDALFPMDEPYTWLADHF